MAVRHVRYRGGTGGGGSQVFSVSGQTKLYILARTLRQLGDRDLSNQLLRGMTWAVRPMKPAIKASALATLPNRGGLARTIASSRIITRRRTGRRTAGVSLVTSSRHEIRGMDHGRLRHPVFGDEEVWVTQNIPTGWWSTPVRENSPRVRQDLEHVMESIIRQLAYKLGK